MMSEIIQNKDNSLSSLFPEDAVDFKKIFDQLYRHIWTILGVSIFTFFLAFLYTFTIEPQFQSTALIQINTQATNSSMLNKLGYKSEGSSLADTQLALFKTRYILEPVIVKNHLNMTIAPKYFPIFGSWMAKHHQEPGLAKSFLGLSSYAWGGEELEFKNFSTTSAFSGQNFQLIVGKDNSYRFYTAQGKLILTGKIGELVSDETNSISLQVSKLIAHEGTKFNISFQSPISMSNSIARNLKISPILGIDPLQSTGIYQIQFSSSRPDRTIQTLNAIIDYAIARNAQQKAKETENTLKFLDNRLPVLKQNLEQAEDAMNKYHSRNQTLNMTMTGQMLAKNLLATQQALQKLRTEKEELLQIYTPQHPIMITALNKEIQLEKELAGIKKEMQKFPFENQKEVKLFRDVKIKNSMYLSLLNNEEQLKVVQAGVIPDIQLLADATPASQIPSHKLLLMLLGFLMGMLTSSILIIIKNSFTKTVVNSDHLENEIQIRVHSVIPFSRKQKQIEKMSQHEFPRLVGKSKTPLLLAKQAPDDIAIESLRSLRVSLQMMSSSSAHHIYALMGSMSNIGKSFVSLNFSQILAESGKRTLLIDGDIRKGRINQTLHQPKSNGLCEFLEGKCHLEDIIRPIHDNLFFISNGAYTKHPIQLLQSQLFNDLIQKVKTDFDQVIFDTAPVLPVTDAVLISKHCDVRLFVVSAAKDTIGDVKQAVKKLQTHGIEIDGMILNHRKPQVPYGAPHKIRYVYGDKDKASTAAF